MVYENVLNNNIYVKYYKKIYKVQMLTDRVTIAEKIKIARIENQKILEQLLIEKEERKNKGKK